jgi:regulatory protein
VQSFEHTDLQRYGSIRIAMAMRERGVDEALVRESLDRIKQTELERAWAIWNKRFGQQGLPTEPRAYARQARFLAARGFAGDVVSKILAGRFDGPDEL